MKVYTVYLRHVKDADFYYVGTTTNMKNRGRRYNSGNFRNYIKGNNADTDDNIDTFVLYKTNSKDIALKLEQWFISIIPMEKCLNMKKSGGEWRADKNKAKRDWYAGNEEEKKKNYARVKNRRSTLKGKIYYRVDNWNRAHPTSKLITPQEAVDMFELTGWVPPFVKNNDLIN